MATRRWTRLGGALTAALTLALMGSTSFPEARKVPAYLMIRGGGLEEPVVLHHGTGPEEGIRTDSPIMGVIVALNTSGGDVPDPVTSRYYEVLEFWAGPSVPVRSADGSPSEPLDPETATSISTIYPDEPGGPIWNLAGLRAPADLPAPYRRIEASGWTIFQGVGLTIER
jgi:hypothetical protein